MFERLLSLITNEQWQKIEQAKILLVGVGGVGGYALESLVRSGFRDITIVDGDFIAESNLNRQIIAKTDNLGCLKVMEAKKRALDICPDIVIHPIPSFLTPNNFANIIYQNYDYIIDACDDIPVKVQLIKYALEKHIKLITCLGTGRKIDPTKLEITFLNKTFNDPLAKKLRHELRCQNLSLAIPVLFSKEEAIPTKEMIGSAIFVPASAGILLANYVFMDILKS